MKRRLFNILAAVSLVLCVATGALWVRSYWRADVVVWSDQQVDRGLFSVAGEIGVHRTKGIQFTDWDEIAVTPRCNKMDGGQCLGFVWFSGHGPATTSRWLVAVPHWSLALLLAFPGLRLLRRCSVRRHSGLCIRCGYDLRATPERCPECGTAVPAGHTPEVGR
jgi:hypothetical protein